VRVAFLKKKNREKGQSLFEFLVFLPIMLVCLTSLISFGSAINASINQQKIARGYFFALLRGNAFANRHQELVELEGGGVNNASMFFIGWADKMSGESPYAPCYKITNVLSSSAPNEECKGKTTGDTSQFVKVKTVFGLCTTTYENHGYWLYRPFSDCSLH